jgi:hypothetical protein
VCVCVCVCVCERERERERGRGRERERERENVYVCLLSPFSSPALKLSSLLVLTSLFLTACIPFFSQLYLVKDKNIANYQTC